VRWIETLLALPEDTNAAERAALLRDAGALAYKLRALPPARAAWDAVRAHCERTLAPTTPRCRSRAATWAGSASSWGS